MHVFISSFLLAVVNKSLIFVCLNELENGYVSVLSNIIKKYILGF